MKAEIIRGEPTPPPIEEVVLRLTEKEAATFVVFFGKLSLRDCQRCLDATSESQLVDSASYKVATTPASVYDATCAAWRALESAFPRRP